MRFLGWFIGRDADNADRETPFDEHAHVLAIISEIWMLVSYVAGSSTQGLNKIEVCDPCNAEVKLKPAELLHRVSDIERRHAPGGQPKPYDRAFMQIVRDAINLLIWPASGLTVAYTTMVTGPFRERTASRYNLAKRAYANLAGRAFGHRILQFAILCLLLGVTGGAVWESAKVALGKALLQNMDVLRAQQASLNAEKVKLELSLLTSVATTDRIEKLTKSMDLPLASYRLCDRALVLLAMTTHKTAQEVVQLPKDGPGSRLLTYASAEERDICGRDNVLQANLGIIHGDLKLYNQNWPSMVGSGFATARNIMHCIWPTCSDNSLFSVRDSEQDVEFRIAPILLVWGNFLLQILFSFTGSAIFVIMDYYNKVRISVLHPRDRFLAPVRLALGLVVGACVGLLFSAYGPLPQSSAVPSASALVSSLTLTASGVAFLAGFGVETVFSMLETLITRVFTLPSQGVVTRT